MLEHLSPAIRCFQSHAIPTLPIPDASIDLVYAFSVFSHIDEFELAWLAELRRVLKPGGIAYLTTHTDHTWSQLATRTDWPLHQGMLRMAPHVTEYEISEDAFARPLPEKRTVFRPAGRTVYGKNVFQASIIFICPKVASGFHLDKLCRDTNPISRFADTPLNQILNAVARSIDRQHLQRENYLLKHELSSEAMQVRGRLLGSSQGISQIRDTLTRVADQPVPVLFTGDTGTGKEIAARTLHALSDRADKPFVPVNCAAVSPEIIANELFGYVNADRQRQDGLLFHARGGTLFMDEIAELPLSVQATLLRVIEERRIRPIGSSREVPLNLRFIFATNADLEAAVAAGKFRKDLYHRINVMNIAMPTLVERKGDIAELSAMFMHKISAELGMPSLPLTEGVLLKLCCYDWPGNVRELRNLIERSLILGEFPPEFCDDEHSESPAAVDSLQAVERLHILTVLDACDGNRAEAARRLGVSRKTIDRKCAMWDA